MVRWVAAMRGVERWEDLPKEFASGEYLATNAIICREKILARYGAANVLYCRLIFCFVFYQEKMKDWGFRGVKPPSRKRI
jgi:hypothetical protein